MPLVAVAQSRFTKRFGKVNVLESASQKNFFSLDIQANEVILIAGGIGLTPLLAMAFFSAPCSNTISLTRLLQNHVSDPIQRSAQKFALCPSSLFWHADNEGRPASTRQTTSVSIQMGANSTYVDPLVL